MSDEAPRFLDLDVLRASAVKFKEMQAALEARGKELEEAEFRLGAEHISMRGRALALEGVATALRRDREKLARVRLTLNQDAAATEADRLAMVDQQRQLEEMLPALEDRDRLLRGAEDQLKRRTDELTGRMQKSGAKLQILAEREKTVTQRERDLDEMFTRLTATGEALGLREKNLAEREEAFNRLQNECTASLETREKQLVAFCEAMAAMATEAAQRTGSFVGMKAALEEEIDRVAVARESAVAEGEWLREAQEIITGAIEPGEAGSEGAPVSAGPSPSLELLRSDSPESPPIPPEAPTLPLVLRTGDTAQPETRPGTSKEGAVGRLAQAIAAWERARAAGWNVTGLVGQAKSAREALAAGDYEGAIRSATTILTRLHANSVPP